MSDGQTFFKARPCSVCGKVFVAVLTDDDPHGWNTCGDPCGQPLITVNGKLVPLNRINEPNA